MRGYVPGLPYLPLLAVSLVALPGCGVPPAPDLLTAAYVTLNALPIDSLISGDGTLCPEIVVAESARWSEGIPKAGDSLPEAVKLSDAVPAVPWRCAVTAIVPLPALPDTLEHLDTRLLIRLFVVSPPARSHEPEFLAVVDPPGTADATLIRLRLRVSQGAWVVAEKGAYTT
jgi:hypothetical protein